MGLFSEWQPRYAGYGIATFPVRDKRPLVSGYLKVGTAASERLATRYHAEDAFGIACKSSGITVLDVDAPDEKLLADALSEYGPTPFLVRSGSGNYQAWYRNNGERRRVRPDLDRPIDILGDGFVVAPPSRGAKGPYEIIAGSLDDLDRLPPMRRVERASSAQGTAKPVPDRHPLIEAGKRNTALWRECMRRARKCTTITELMEAAMRQNSVMFYEPLRDDEVLRVVASAWSKELSGENWFGSPGQVVAAAAEVDELLKTDPDAFILLMILRRHHVGRQQPFVIANAMAGTVTARGWTRRRFADARKHLETVGQIELIRRASRLNGPSLYRLKGGQK